MALDLDQDTPQDLADAPEDLFFDAVRAVSAWDDARARLVDFVLRQRVVRALTRGAEVPELTSLADQLRRVVLPSRRATLDAAGAPWSIVWGAYAGLVERSVALQSSRDPESTLRKLHVAGIVEMVRKQPGIRQQQIGDNLGLKKGNLTRVLNLMEDEALILRRQEGKENRVFLGTAAPAPAVRNASASGPPVSQPPARGPARTGASYLTLPH